ncbi:MAG: YdcF family protein [Pseudanabaena sp.]|nr:MAG: YdcF family protein [Pseudanabaena sp.]
MLESLIFFAILWVLWLVSPRRWKLRVILPIAIIGVSCMFLTSPIAVAIASQGLTFALLPDTGEKNEAIVILGRGESLRSKRVEAARELWKAQRASKIFVSGMLDAEEIVSQLQNLGIPNSHLSGERCSQTTEENAQYTVAVLHPQRVQKIILVTDAPHMLRSQILFQSFGFNVTPHPIPLSQKLSTTDQLLVVMREYAALASYRWQDRLRQRTQDEIDQPTAEVNFRLKDWNCRVNGEKNKAIYSN